MRKNYIDSMIVKSINNAAHTFNLKLEHQNYVYYILIAYFFLYICAGYKINITQYSPDSWAFFELSKTIFSGDFYSFNTFRSYFSTEQSTSFPFGWPTIIALTSIVFGVNPVNAVYVNIILTILICLIISRVGRILNLPMISSCLIFSALVFYRPYANEVFSGRSMPLAIFLFMFAVYFYQRNILFFAGLFVGLSALVRFDFLIYSIIFQFVALLISRNILKNFFLLVYGFVIGISPWMLYSYINFDKIWVSDNAWVAFSALPAFVVDYPAAPVVSALAEPITWFGRVFWNIPPLFKSLIKSTFYFPIFIGFLFFLILNFNRVSLVARYRLTLLLFSSILALTPYALTGYFDSRYFILFFLVNSVFSMHILNSIADIKYAGLSYIGLNFVLLTITVFIGLIFIGRDVFISEVKLVDSINQESQIKYLSRCHLRNPKSTYIFMNEVGELAPRYGAVTGMRTALIPSNFARMTDVEKSKYFEFMQPYVLIDSLAKVEECTSQ